MNELQRQVYLSALGVDTYMPRWHLPFAPVSVACELPKFAHAENVTNEKIFNESNFSAANSPVNITSLISPSLKHNVVDGQVTPINSLIKDIITSKKPNKSESLVSQPVAALSESKSVFEPAIEAFSLSVWRPIEDMMIVDSRNNKLALPTDALLKNVFRQMFPQIPATFKEEVLRCPMIENSFTKRTADDARAELQTWLSVQCEIKPVKYLWLMGANAFMYLIANDNDKQQNLWHSISLVGTNVQALILPSLNELLIDPALKKYFFSAIRRYHS